MTSWQSNRKAFTSLTLTKYEPPGTKRGGPVGVMSSPSLKQFPALQRLLAPKGFSLSRLMGLGRSSPSGFNSRRSGDRAR